MSLSRISFVDSHTGGEPTRVVIKGGPELGRGSTADQLAILRTKHDSFRRAVVNEPRGSDVLVGALLVKPADESCVTGVIYFDNVTFLGMCGHGTIGLIETLAHLGRINNGVHRIETPVGVITAELHSDGSVSIANIPSYRHAKGVELNIPDAGKIVGDVAWGGNWFYLTENHSELIDRSNLDRLAEVSWKIRQAINANGFPEVDHIVLFGESKRQNPTACPSPTSPLRTKNYVMCPGKAYDRSPCGTGTSARLACLASDGRLEEGESLIQESVIGSHFIGRFQWLDRSAGTIIPTITGRAHVTAEGSLLLDDHDPFCFGITELM